MAKFGLTEDELISLETCLAAALDAACFPDWEFEALLGCTRSEARQLVEAGLRSDHPDERLLDQLVMLLSALSGSAQLSVGRPRAGKGRASARRAVALPELHGLLAKLMGVGPQATERTPELQSSVKLRVPRPLLSTRDSKKRQA